MLKKSGLIAGATMLALTLGSTAALADGCSGRDHTGGTVLGAIAGGMLGGVASHGNGLAIAGGAIFGGMAGNALSRDIDCEDREYVRDTYDDAFEDGDIGRRYEWTGRHGGHGYIVVNDRFRQHGRRCVDFTQVLWRHGDRMERDGVACRYRDGWRVDRY